MVNILPKYAVGLLAALGQGGSWQQLLWASVSSGDDLGVAPATQGFEPPSLASHALV